jgi:hypothetical protein
MMAAAVMNQLGKFKRAIIDEQAMKEIPKQEGNIPLYSGVRD